MSRNVEKSLKASLRWFEKSGIMDPPDGSWGVAERVLVTKDNEALEKTFTSFPSYIEHDGYALIEHRRPDCNFETALLFLLAYKLSKKAKYLEIARNLLVYLHRRSNMQNFNGRQAGYPPNAWRWSHDQCVLGRAWFDDNAWNCVIPLIISKLHPAFDKEFKLRDCALSLASEIEKAFTSHFPEQPAEDSGALLWQGDLKSPHWGSLAAMAMAFAYAETHDAKYTEAIKKYNAYLLESKGSFSSSECAYAVIGASAAAAATGDNAHLEIAKLYADILVDGMDKATGKIPSEWGKEAPTGENLVDLIYTQNWALLGLQSLCAIEKDKKYSQAFEKALELVVSIQDKSPERQFKGCWRGMYDMNARAWGGGNRFEGGANSVYSGWTNAPIAIVMASKLLGIAPLTDLLAKR